jgi:hypothetical protein
MIARALAPLLVAAALVRPARADDVEKADKLFAEGRALMDTDLHAACDKFEESLKWNSQALGTMLNVALCDERLGRVASAAAKYADVRDRAREDSMSVHREAAEARLKEVLPRVPHVTIRLAQTLPGTRIVIDQQVIAPGQLGQELPIDPGDHVLVVSAPDHVAYQTTVRLAEAEHREVEVPALRTASSRRTIGKIVAITGGATLVTGVVIGVVARGRYNDAFDKFCTSSSKECDPEGLSETRSARTLGWVGTTIGAVGIVGAGVGLYLWMRSPAEHRASAHVSLLPHLDPGAPGVAVMGRF